MELIIIWLSFEGVLNISTLAWRQLISLNFDTKQSYCGEAVYVSKKCLYDVINTNFEIK